MHRRLAFLPLVALLLVSLAGAQVPGTTKRQEKGLRPPSVPLVAHDPYFSIWSPADRLTDADTVHWTGTRQSLSSEIVVDGKSYRLMGAKSAETPALPQTAVRVLPTRTIYEFQNEQVRVILTFTTPTLPDDLDVFARPVTYLTWEVASADGKPHKVQLIYHNTAEPAVNEARQEVVWDRPTIEGFTVVRVGTKAQPVLGKKGDNLRIDWGYLYIAIPADQQGRINPAEDSLPNAAIFDLGEVAAQPVARHLLLAYDDLYSIVYFGKHLRPYWRRNGAEAADLLKAAAKDYADLTKRCKAFDEQLMADLEKAGGPQYARICALAYRQCFAGHKLAADARGMPLLFAKENFSNGCISTVDVIYPAAPQLLLFSPALTKAMLVPVLDYACTPRWKFSFAPHDLGTYPMANGQVYGGGEKTEHNQMPVEESGNMILVLAALAQAEGNADFAQKYWPLVEKWAEFLKSKGLDPDNQLCTDDFAGHLAHNVNLSAKAILALGAYAKLCEMTGHGPAAAEYRKIAEEYAARWVRMADDGDHTRLAFDRSGTWSQKYNLVWDRLLGLNLFPAEVARKEVAYYKKVQKPYGLPLDNRQGYTKLDWSIWSASLAEKPEDFQALVAPVHAFLDNTPTRVPMTDWYWTAEPKYQGFQARPVVGGVFIKMLYDSAVWKKWVAASGKATGQWAPSPAAAK